MLAESPAETLLLRDALRDLEALSIIPAASAGREPPAIAARLADVLTRSLHLDFAFVRLRDPSGGATFEQTRGRAWRAFPELLRTDLDGGGRPFSKEIISDLGDAGACRGVVVPIGVDGEGGLVAAASARAGFPTDTDQLLISLAANHAAAAFQNARLRGKLDSKVAELRQARSELDIKVAERASQFAGAHQELRKEIADRKRAEEALRESELNLCRMTETIPEMLWSATPDGSIDYCNARFLVYTGFPAQAIKGGGWLKAIHPDDARRVAPLWMSSVATGSPYRVEVRILRASDRMYRWCAVSALPLFDQCGRVLKWHGTILDLHDLKRAQEELHNTRAELAHMARVMTMGELTASIAHEVNQPLAAIVASGDSCKAWLASVPPNVDKARAAMDRMIQAATQAGKVVQRIRTMFRKTSSVTASLKINEVIEETMSLIRTEIVSKHISLRTDLARDIPPVTGDRVQIAQVILNLAVNGIEAMAEEDEMPRSLCIQSARAENAEICVSVADSGPGLNPKVTARLFDPFFTTKAKGIGVGLSISRSIIEAHGGRLWAAPNQPRGAAFHFVLPATSGQ